MTDVQNHKELGGEPGRHHGQKGRRWALALAGLAAAGFLTFFLSTSGAEQDKPAADPGGEPPRGLPVEAVQVGTEAVERTLTAVGSLQSDESIVISTEIAGLVETIPFSEGEQVKAGQILLRLEDSVLQAELDRARASLQLSRANFQRAKVLLADDAISEREKDEAYAKWQLDQANVRLAEANLAKTVIRAPFTGRLGLRNVSPGAYLRPGEPIVNLDAIDPIKVDFSIPEGFARQVQVGQTVQVTVDAVPGVSFPGQVMAIAPQLETAGRSLLVRARLENDEKILSPGMFARIALVLEQRSAALMVPEEALIAQGEQQLVYKVVDGKVVAAPVSLGIREKGRVEIREGLDAGDTVITAGHIKVRPGMPVTVLPAAAQNEAGEKPAANHEG
ncbi:MAG TPA: efflux RND transporter periplasmic adaptor subunit [Desulfuromonadales bacterium]|nr:efflux RND transporter periplasmic adaptor subunit [Desulfuromonadales bacterium]